MLLLDHRDTAAAAGDHNLVCIGECLDGCDLHDVDWLGRGDDSAIAAFGFHDVVSFVDFCVGVLLGHIAPDRLFGIIKGIIVGIDGHLRQNRADRLGDAATEQL